MKKKDKKTKPAPAFDKTRVLELIACGTDKRDLARILALKGRDRIQLMKFLKQLKAEGAIAERPRRDFGKAGELPEIAIVEMTGIDADGDATARPLSWSGEHPAPPITLTSPKQATAPVPGDRFLARLERRGDSYQAQVIRVLEPQTPTRLIGVLRGPASSGWRLVPIDKKARREYALDTSDLNGAKDNELVAAEPRPGSINGLARVKVLERIGSMDSPKTISLIAIHDHGIPTDFPLAVIEEAKAAKPIDAQTAKQEGRIDLRSLGLITIDPPDARDHDDAVWAGPDPDPANPGGHLVVVAIADVAHYVTPDSALDKEALKRGNSVYFPDRVVAMLPEELSADLCSLRQDADRPCLVARMVFDRHGHKKSHVFQRAIMRSAAALSYQRAQAAFDGKADAQIGEAVRKTLADLWAAYQALSLARDLRDPLNLDLPERRVILGADGKVSSIAIRERLASMKLIEEFMVLANVAAAEALEKARTPLIYRVHDSPSKEKLYAFSDFLRTLNISFAKGQVVQPGTFNRILAASKGKPHEAVMNDVVLRSQAQAIYDPANIGHFGLNLAKYAHFTSPIRRYADLIVHRALIKAFGMGRDGLSAREMASLGSVAEHITMTERRAMAAERDSTDRYVAAFMQERLGESFDARVTGVTRFGLFVRLAGLGAEGLIPIRSLGADYFHHDEKRQVLVGQRSHRRYGMGDVVAVTLVEAAPLTGGLRFGLVEDRSPPANKPGKSLATIPGKRRPAFGGKRRQKR